MHREQNWVLKEASFPEIWHGAYEFLSNFPSIQLNLKIDILPRALILLLLEQILFRVHTCWVILSNRVAAATSLMNSIPI